MYSFITQNQSIQIRGILKVQSVGELAATINEDFRNQKKITIDLSELQELTLSTVMKLITLQTNYRNSGKLILFKGLSNKSVSGTFGLAGKRYLLGNVA
ncbi:MULTISPECIES: STAS domain-containing protein [Leeuwenhoekiella]|jgi:anti-anti-sigma regulatory factor|uniref:STAS domain-containing protein n=1 Tax=Leeuwenhoekiella blandensis (strain CECT 7118 / CCUG 51940 / KCTC 22103 / MED217) TaxID=398720 RepID=A3XMY5_LEEBM|nr:MULTISPECIES: STAS domain-containing protein [Leeuwenhoekiella]EAQ49091.1 hypothetical protein MED217_06796 [Leeuwenhoekiella blandensis MED217]MAO45468.1 hypothetical protein [Leeuwenhoekiella sp.]MBQ50846.1 hypothetical protein [Leeuwenhoekiella sp.]HBT09221.1 hypothetical protein [Leeuwenhoekiella sp.]HCW65346.1 hypothetical protein [Leeuwenhoekiella sp.]|tara:strand:- start:1901 stop:2197 length:297 start_codon:yes stop_codon:yes gene_type:complete